MIATPFSALSLITLNYLQCSRPTEMIDIPPIKMDPCQGTSEEVRATELRDVPWMKSMFFASCPRNGFMWISHESNHESEVI